MSANVRIRLKFEQDDINGNKAQLFLVRNKNVATIGDLSAAITNKFYHGFDVEISLLIDEFVLPVDERVDLIRDNDVILVKCVSPSKKKTVKRQGGKAQNPKVTKVDEFAVDSIPGVEMGPVTPSTKKFEYTRGYEFQQPLSSSTPYVLLKKISNLASVKTVHLSSFNETEKMDEAFVFNLLNKKIVNHKSAKEIELTSTKSNKCGAKTNLASRNKRAAFDKSFFSDCIELQATEKNIAEISVIDEVNFEEQMKYERCESLTSIPTIGDVIAFRIMKISSTSYLPEVSEFKAGKIINVNSNTQMLCVELLRDDLIKEFCRPNIVARSNKLYVDWNTLVDPKLLSRINNNAMLTSTDVVSTAAFVHIKTEETVATNISNEIEIVSSEVTEQAPELPPILQTVSINVQNEEKAAEVGNVVEQSTHSPHIICFENNNTQKDSDNDCEVVEIVDHTYGIKLADWNYV